MQLFAIVIFSPVFLIAVLVNKKYRSRILDRLGFEFNKLIRRLPRGKRRIWLHALSVGEVASVRTLVRKIRHEQPEAVILFSCTTASGKEYARTSLQGTVDFVFTFPLDLIWLVKRYISSISPDLFILVETDFWPNFLYTLKKNKVPAVLVNSRVSSKSFRFYQFFRPVVLPRFMAFDYLCVQRRLDRDNMVRIGVPPERVLQPGNLKYDGFIADEADIYCVNRADFAIPDDALLIVAGSTHPGEEEMLFDFFGKVSGSCDDLRLIVAPRRIERCRDVLGMARGHGLSCRLKTEALAAGIDVIILDTLGELAKVYGFADLTFVGGSLIPEGGHNPLEPAALGKPVIFGPYMEDFYDIATEMIDEGAAVQVQSSEELDSRGSQLLRDPSLREDLGRRAIHFVAERRGAVDKYYRVIENLLKDASGDA